MKIIYSEQNKKNNNFRKGALMNKKKILIITITILLLTGCNQHLIPQKELVMEDIVTYYSLLTEEVDMVSMNDVDGFIDLDDEQKKMFINMKKISDGKHYGNVQDITVFTVNGIMSSVEVSNVENDLIIVEYNNEYYALSKADSDVLKEILPLKTLTEEFVDYYQKEQEKIEALEELYEILNPEIIEYKYEYNYVEKENN